MSEFFNTNDLALAAWLRCNNVKHDHFEKIERECVWVYVLTDQVGGLVLEYVSDTARVKPKEFAQKLGLVRTEMYRFMGHGRANASR